MYDAMQWKGCFVTRDSEKFSLACAPLALAMSCFTFALRFGVDGGVEAAGGSCVAHTMSLESMALIFEMVTFLYCGEG